MIFSNHLERYRFAITVKNCLIQAKSVQIRLTSASTVPKNPSKIPRLDYDTLIYV